MHSPYQIQSLAKPFVPFPTLAEKSPSDTGRLNFVRKFDFTPEFSIMKMFSDILLGI